MPVAELEKLIGGLNEDNYNAAVKFVLFLSESQKSGKSADEKDAFFQAVGKINLDPDEVTAFREKSLI